jgi:photosystem II stability/assembly factor-like uncharacterized protein
MKTCFITMLVFFSVLCLVERTGAQEWQWSNPQPQGNMLWSVYFLNDNTGFAVGRMGTILKTTDGGTHWKVTYLQNHALLLSIHFYSNEVGIVVGNDGTILRTINEGETWEDRSIDPDLLLSSVYLVDSNTGYITAQREFPSDGMLYKTTDGGETWALTKSTNSSLSAVFSIGQDTVFVGGFYGIFRSVDGGLNWLDSVATTYRVETLYFTDSFNGIAAGGGGNTVFMKTADGGNSWTSLYWSVPHFSYDQVFFSSDLTGYAIGTDDGTGVIKTTDGGVTWNLVSSMDEYLYDIFFLTDETGYIVGGTGAILKTTNGGINWEPISRQVNDDFYSIYFTGRNKGFVSGNKTITRTENGGLEWEKIIGGVDYERLYQITFENENEGYAAGHGYFTYYTKDGGNSWNTMSAGTWPLFNGIDIPPRADSGYLVGEDCLIVKFNTQISGGYWKFQHSPFENTSDDYFSVYFPARDTGFITGSSGIIIRTYNGGYPWEALNSNTSASLMSVFFPSDQIGYVVGTEGTILKTTDNGTTWNPQVSGTLKTLYCVHFYNDNFGYIAGASGRILKTRNGGATWIAEETNTENDLHSVFIYDTNTIYVAGKGSTILKSTAGGFTRINETELNKKSILSVFPNPLNNSSSVTFEIQTGGMVEISLYDLSGKKVKSLLHGVMAEGKHQVRLYKENIPPGIYFLRMVSGEEAGVIKLIMM